MIRQTACSVLILLVLAACGVKGPVRPKGKPAPPSAENLSVRQQGTDLLLAWNPPARSSSHFADLIGFSLYRTGFDPQNYCEECRDPDIPIARFEIDFPTPAVRKGNNLYYRDTGRTINEGYRYRLWSDLADGSPGGYVQARHILLPPPLPPTGLTATIFDRAIRLNWSIPESLPDSSEYLGVNIYRGQDIGPLELIPINYEPLSGSLHEDLGLENDIGYRYGLRSVIRSNDMIIESILSETIIAVPTSGF